MYVSIWSPVKIGGTVGVGVWLEFDATTEPVLPPQFHPRFWGFIFWLRVALLHMIVAS